MTFDLAVDLRLKKCFLILCYLIWNKSYAVNGPIKSDNNCRSSTNEGAVECKL
jgi:hypothetical protein